ncbi:MAG TPA: Flp pilus assembly protein CpaB [Vicinamibacterales bacterium]|nr:Flp pilus assembly protein CpaB [Vicinamibacterales bacterium]
MNRNNRTVVVLAIAVIMAGIASFGVYRVVANLPARQEVPTVNAVVAAHPLKLGTRITKDHVKLVNWPASSPVPGAYTKIEDVLDRGLISPLDENEPLTDSKLAALEAGVGLPPSIPDGMRALSVKVNEVVGVAGFVVPGTRVDVMATLGGRREEGGMTKVVVSNVQVLTAGTRYDNEKAKEGEAMPSSVVTLLVTPEDAERITLAATEGHLMLTLRNPLDVEPTVTTGARTAGIFGGQPAAVPPPSKPVGRKARPVAATVVAPAPEPVKPRTVEAIRGAKRTEEVIRQEPQVNRPENPEKEVIR